MPILYRDYETRSTLSLTDVGAWRYAGEASTDIWCASFAVDDGPVQTWLPGQPIPQEFQIAATDPDWLIVAHNDAFESTIEERLLGPRYDWPTISIERHRCTMAMALAAALPAKLETVAAALDLPIRKDSDGHKLMMQMSRPRKDGNYWIDDPEKLHRLIVYNVRDVEVERALYKRLPPLSADEQKLWQLDAAINRRGFHVDIALAKAAHTIVHERRGAINHELAELTNGQITSIAQVARIGDFLKEHGHKVAGVDKRSVAAVLAHKPDDDVARLLRLRQEGGISSASKLDALLAMANDERIHGALRFHGAATGRWTGHGYQPHNLSRSAPADPEATIAAVRSGDLARVASIGPPLEVVASLSRAMICAAPGKTLISADYSSIEPRVLCWLADEKWKLDAFRKFDAIGDLAFENYCLVASRVLGRTVTPEDEEGRQTGKYMELAFGYGGALGAFRKIAPDADFTDAQVETFKGQWRAAHPKIVKFWGDLHRMLLRAVRIGKPATLKNLSAEMRNGNLYLVLPSGRAIVYPESRIESGQYSDQIIFKDSAIGKWRDARGWHGTFTENVVQAISRDLLAAAMQRLETAGYPIVLHVHDEIVAEVAEDFGSPEDFARIMTTLPPWAEGLPLVAKPSRRKRYAKEKNGNATIDEPPKDEAPSVPADDTIIPASSTVAAAIAAMTAAIPRGTITEHSAAPNNGNQNRQYPHGESRSGRRIATYLYLDYLGSNHTKIEKKHAAGRAQYPQSFWVQGRWVSQKPKGWVKVPYRLPEMLAALAKDPSANIFNPEGEKDCETLAALQLITTTNSEGATPLKAKVGKWAPELSRWFYGVQRLFILADNDEVGRVFAQEKARALEAIVPDIRIIHFPDVPAGEDVSYWLNDLGHSKAELLARCEATERWQGGGTLESMRADQVVMRAIHWLWGKRFAVGKIGIIAGLPDEGKGQILCYIAARVTRGFEWPNGEGISPQGNVIILSAEENAGDSLAPRLEAAGADLSRIHFVSMVRDRDEKTGQERKRMFSLISDLEKLRRKIIEVGDVVAILIDPISAYLGIGQVDSYRDTDVRAVLGPLKELAEEMKTSVITVMHFNKKVDITNALLRVSNSMAFVGLPRHAYGVIADAENARKLFVRAKNNDAAEADNKTLAFHFDAKEVGTDPDTSEPIRAPFIVWEPGYVDVTATEAMTAVSENKSPGERNEAKQFLHDLLLVSPNRRAPQMEIEDYAKAEKITNATLRRAKRDLKIRSEKDRAVKDGPWYWVLPDD